MNIEAIIEKTKSSTLDPTPFSISKRTLSSLDILKDTPFDYDEWHSEHAENSWVIKAVKIWFAIHKKYTH